MTNVPDLTDKTIAEHSLLLGFSYSLTPDGSPGSYNERIAQNMRRDMNQAQKGGAIPWVGMQWEIFDALVEQDESDSFKASQFIPKSHVAAPPQFVVNEFRNPASFMDLLTSGPTRAARELCDQLGTLGCNLSTASLSSTELAAYLNQLLDKQDSFRRYEATLELHDLHRMQLGAIGTEKRTLPQGNQYPKGLREFQAKRINRLMIESICPDDDILKRGQYLSTQGVLNLLLPQVKQDGRDIEFIFVYGHPQHSPRCRNQTIKSLKEHDWTLPESHVYDMHEGQDWPWDSTTAQIWCRSLENWQDYERMGKKRLSQ